MRGLKGKGVFISGASRGIGYAAAQRFLEEGCRVYFCGLDTQEVAQAVRQLSRLGPVEGMACDISREEDVARFVEAGEAWLNGIDILINNAGIAWEEPFLETTAEHLDRILGVNLRGMFLVAQAVAKKMVAHGKGGVIVNMSSKNGLAGEVKYSHYNASKGGIILLTKTMALELGPHGIRVNSLCPGYIVTPMSQEIDSPEFVATYVNNVPLGRLGKPEEVAAAYAFLASDEASFIHGTELLVDGGQLAV